MRVALAHRRTAAAKSTFGRHLGTPSRALKLTPNLKAPRSVAIVGAAWRGLYAAENGGLELTLARALVFHLQSASSSKRFFLRLSEGLLDAKDDRLLNYSHLGRAFFAFFYLALSEFATMLF